jgi:hypothetical protein
MVSRYAAFAIPWMVRTVTFCTQKEQELAEMKKQVDMILNDIETDKFYISSKIMYWFCSLSFAVISKYYNVF